MDKLDKHNTADKFDRKKSVEYAKSGRLLPQAVRYAVVAFMGYAADYAVLWLLTELAGVHYLQAGVVAFVLGLIVNYFAGRAFAFRVKDKSSFAEVATFAAVSIGAIAINEAVLFLATDGLGVHHMVSKLISGVLTFVWNYLMRRYVVYRKKGTR